MMTMTVVESATSINGDTKQQDKKGWLSKRTQFTHRWKPAWFQLKDTQLVYGENEEVRSITRMDGGEMNTTVGHPHRVLALDAAAV